MNQKEFEIDYSTNSARQKLLKHNMCPIFLTSSCTLFDGANYNHSVTLCYFQEFYKWLYPVSIVVPWHVENELITTQKIIIYSNALYI